VTVVLYYHQLGTEPSPLAVSPALFSEHLAVVAESGLRVVTAAELADAVREGSDVSDLVAITFDDGFAAAVSEAATRLAAAEMRATFFCVAGHLGGRSDWPSRLPDAPVEPLATADDLRTLAAGGHEIGSHGWTHAPLDGAADLERELVASRRALEDAVGAEVRTFAYPYGALPSAAAARVVAATYEAAYTTRIGRVSADSSRFELPRVDAHYVRDPRVLRRVLAGALDTYLGFRRLGSRTRRALRKDYVAVGAA